MIHVHTREVQGYWFCLPICCHQLHITNHRLYCHQLLATWTWFFFRVNRKKNGGVLNLLTRVGFYCKRVSNLLSLKFGKTEDENRTEQNRSVKNLRWRPMWTMSLFSCLIFVFVFLPFLLEVKSNSRSIHRNLTLPLMNECHLDWITELINITSLFSVRLFIYLFIYLFMWLLIWHCSVY